MGFPHHGLSHLIEHPTWMRMRSRCNNPKNPKYPRYGGRGIRVCAEWEASFERFYADMGPKPSPAHSIDRIDNNGNYEPGNCRWATNQQQARNQSRTRTFTAFGETRLFIEWLEIYGRNYSLVRSRLHLGWSLERALTEPSKPHCPPPSKPSKFRQFIPQMVEMRKAGKYLREIALEFGISTSMVKFLILTKERKAA